MPPRISPTHGGPRGGRPSRGGHPGGANRGSQPGGPLSEDATPPTQAPAPESPGPTPQVNLPIPSRARPSSNHGDGASRGGAPRSPPSTTTLNPTETGSTTSSQGPARGRGRGGRGGHRGGTRGSLPIGLPSPFQGGRGRGGTPDSPPNVVATHPVISPIPTEASVTTSSQGEVRGRGRGRGGHRGNTRAFPGDSPAPSRGGRGGTPIIPPSVASTLPVVTPPLTEIATTSSPQGVARGRGRGRGGHRGGTRGFPSDFPSPFRGGGTSRGRGGSGRPTAGGPTDTVDAEADIPDHIVTFGAKRPGFGSGGRATKIIVNAFPTTLPECIIHQYDVVHNDKFPARFNMELLRSLQEAEPGIFTPKVVYDGRKIMFSVHELPLGPENSGEFHVIRPRSNGGPPKVYDIILSKSATVNSELLQKYVQKQLSHDENVSTILAALNVAIKMEPNQVHPFNKRSFYIPNDKKDIGGGIELWRGIFQSVRPTLDRLIVNVDLSTGMMYKEGPLLNLCIDFFGRPQGTSPRDILEPPRLREIERVKLQKFLSGVRVQVETTGTKPRVVRGLSNWGANTHAFEILPGIQMTVAQYFQNLGFHLQYPSVICAVVGQGAIVPLELCTVPRGQFMRKEIPDDKVRDILAFSSKKPHERLRIITDGLQHLRYGRSEYVQTFGMAVDETPLSTDARVINPPRLKYNDASRQPYIDPKDGAWNMIDKKFYRASKIVRWVVVIYDHQRNFPQQAYEGMVRGFLSACDGVGIEVVNRDPIYKYENGQGSIDKHLMNAVRECERQFKESPTLIVIVLPNSAGDIYNAVKHFGDITFGIPTQCLKAFQCRNAKPQYWNNVMLKVNVKLGGINVIPDPSSLAAAALTDPANPTIVMGADVMHPPPGVNRPSYTAVIGSIDSHTAKYVATSRAQTGKKEIINDMKEMCMTILGQYKEYQVNVEKNQFDLSRLIFYRDGVSEAEFKKVLNLELPMIKAACEEFGVNPKITLIVVGKRHHIRFFPSDPRDGDRSGNCHAGTVVDRDVTHPTDHDFYLLSHAGILGTSRPAHYSVLYDESGFNASSLQSLSYSLCHVYAASTRSVSIPAPVYYADKVCSRAKTHFDPQEHFAFNDAATNVSGSTNLEAFKDGYRPLHANQQRAMYFA